MFSFLFTFENSNFISIKSGQRFDTNSGNEGSTNKLETNGYGVNGSTQQQMYTSTNNQGKLNKKKKTKVIYFV
jgi:hypothetical protein